MRKLLSLILAVQILSVQLSAAVIYVRSTDGSDADDGSTWALAKATLAAALTAAGAGGTVYVSGSHAEAPASGTSISLTSPGTASSPTSVLCVNDAAEPPTALATTCTATTTGNSAINFQGGHAYVYGIAFSASSGVVNNGIYMITNASWSWVLDSCKLILGSTSSSPGINIGLQGTTPDQLTLWKNTTVQFGAVGQSIKLSTVKFYWRDTLSAVAGTPPTTLITPLHPSSGAYIDVAGVDFSALTSGKNLVDIGSSSTARIFIRNSKLSSTANVKTGTVPGPGGTELYLDNSDSGDTNYRMAHYKYQGSIVSETTVVKTGGASDGTTALSWKMVSLAGANFNLPLDSPPIYYWNDTTGASKVLTVEILHDSAADLTESEVWLEVEYLGTSGFPISSTATDHNSTALALSTTAQAAGTGIGNWTTTGLSTPRSQKVSVTITPAEKGPYRARVMLTAVGGATKTIYVDPKLTVQ